MAKLGAVEGRAILRSNWRAGAAALQAAGIVATPADATNGKSGTVYGASVPGQRSTSFHGHCHHHRRGRVISLDEFDLCQRIALLRMDGQITQLLAAERVCELAARHID